MKPLPDNVELSENSEGVHLLSPVNSEYTLCGDSWEHDKGVVEGHVPTESRAVTCPRCISVIEACRAVRIRRPRKPT